LSNVAWPLQQSPKSMSSVVREERATAARLGFRNRPAH
jgi:hypothetical protein